MSAHAIYSACSPTRTYTCIYIFAATRYKNRRFALLPDETLWKTQSRRSLSLSLSRYSHFPLVESHLSRPFSPFSHFRFFVKISIRISPLVTFLSLFFCSFVRLFVHRFTSHTTLRFVSPSHCFSLAYFISANYFFLSCFALFSRFLFFFSFNSYSRFNRDKNLKYSLLHVSIYDPVFVKAFQHKSLSAEEVITENEIYLVEDEGDGGTDRFVCVCVCALRVR